MATARQNGIRIYPNANQSQPPCLIIVHIIQTPHQCFNTGSQRYS